MISITARNTPRKPVHHLNLTLSLADVDCIIRAARSGEPAWRIAARFSTSQKRIREICRLEGVEVSS